ncbi:hypothetical protein R3X27_24800 [Tropicimonas sp. TH_r6]|uniref:hypothetical protein n=1 Tax=Tropicimonas sp. TH_r6 TaxID=3082085 RepID=UPI0029552954|nr:hypothetical protein [Tropicimonas sp. TH_r6]MDV7145909.1 hypothetical protein [Tropicimonas sp. TH_r6]
MAKKRLRHWPSRLAGSSASASGLWEAIRARSEFVGLGKGSQSGVVAVPTDKDRVVAHINEDLASNGAISKGAALIDEPFGAFGARKNTLSAHAAFDAELVTFNGDPKEVEAGATIFLH